MKCPYCVKPAELVTGMEVYGKWQEKFFWRCQGCDAYVGCHPGTKTPLGSLANANLRDARSHAHAMFDPLWQSGKMTRSEAYAKLAEFLNIPVEACHIGYFDEYLCYRTIDFGVRECDFWD